MYILAAYGHITQRCSKSGILADIVVLRNVHKMSALGSMSYIFTWVVSTASCVFLNDAGYIFVDI